MNDSRPPTPEDLISTVKVRKEIWRSLIATFRVYASLEALGHGNVARIRETGRDGLTIELNNRKLVLAMDVKNGRGEWDMESSAGEFTLSDSGVLMIGSEPKELDAAAIEWLERLSLTLPPGRSE